MGLRDVGLFAAGAFAGAAAAAAILGGKGSVLRTGDDQPIIMSGGSINVLATGLSHTFEPDGGDPRHLVHASSGSPTLSRTVTSVDVVAADGISHPPVPGGNLNLKLTCNYGEEITFHAQPGNALTMRAKSRHIQDDRQANNHAHVYTDQLSVINIQAPGYSHAVSFPYAITIHYVGVG
jgi:hypothetical protein